jgi:hypothetical protein
MKTNCGCGGPCCKSKPTHTLRGNLVQGKRRYEELDGRQYVVVPIVMAKAGVVMNGSLTVLDEFEPFAWNGRPVTVGHPEEGGEFHTASAPDIITDWVVGQLFNAEVDGDSLKAEAWIDIEKAKRVYPGLLGMIAKGEPLDVSTGFFADDEEATGVSDGREYTVISRNWRPDHLALLPDEEGACNWEDGCGVRSNTNRGTLMKLKKRMNSAVGGILSALGFDASDEAKKAAVAKELNKLVGNARGNSDDVRQIVADLISNDASPFTPDDEESLRMMSEDTIKSMADQYLTATEEEPAVAEDEEPEAMEEEEPVVAEDEEVAANEDEEEVANADEEEKAAKKNGRRFSDKQLAAFVSKEVSKQLGKHKLAINAATRVAAEHREKLVTKIVTNSTMKKRDLVKFDLAQLEVIANGVHPAPNYGGKATHANAIFDDEDPALEAMSAPSAGALIKKNAKARKEAH